MGTVIKLKPHDIVKGRSFSHPNHTFYDRRTLCYMIERLCRIIETNQLFTYRTTSLVLHQLEADGRHHRLVLNSPPKLARLKGLALVGFFGQRCNDANPEPIIEVDKTLLEELCGHPGLLSYCTMELTNGDYANCVLFVDEEAIGHWSKSETHRRTANELARAYYDSIRIYNGALAGGIRHAPSLRLTRVKYYDYQTSDYWRAVRTIEQDSTLPIHLSRDTAYPKSTENKTGA